jgi:hypothetical protein
MDSIKIKSIIPSSNLSNKSKTNRLPCPDSAADAAALFAGAWHLRGPHSSVAVQQHFYRSIMRKSVCFDPLQSLLYEVRLLVMRLDETSK